MTRKLRTRLRRAIGLGLAMGVVIAPNALAKPYVDPASVLTPNATTAPQGSIPVANGYSFHRPAVASAIAMKHATYSGSSFYRPAPAKVTYYDAWHVPATPSAGGSIAVTHDTWGNDVRTAVTKQAGVAPTSGSHEARDVLLAASAAGLLLIGGSSLVLMLRRRRAQLA